MSYQNRLKFVAGLLDSDGHLADNCYDFISKYKNISESLAFMVRSVGLKATIIECIKGIKETGFTGIYHRVYISGNTDIIPCIIERKKATPTPTTNPILEPRIVFVIFFFLAVVL